jgi:hypothetical protein
MFERNLTTSHAHVSAGQITLHLMHYLQRCGLEWTKFYVVFHRHVSSLSLNNAFKVDLSVSLGSVENKTNMYKSGYTLVTLLRSVTP